MNGLQPANKGLRTLAALLLSLVTIATLGAQSSTGLHPTSSVGHTVDLLARRGVFEGPDDEEHTRRFSAADRRIQWLTFYLIYADDVLSRYSPGGAAGARFDLFQFAGFSDAQPFGYPIHISVTDRHTTLMGVVDTADDKYLAEVRAREVPGVVDVENALMVAP
jgi:BON domain